MECQTRVTRRIDPDRDVHALSKAGLKVCIFSVGICQMRIVTWVPLLACPAVPAKETLLGKPAVAPTNECVITFENCHKK